MVHHFSASILNIGSCWICIKTRVEHRELKALSFILLCLFKFDWFSYNDFGFGVGILCFWLNDQQDRLR